MKTIKKNQVIALAILIAFIATSFQVPESWAAQQPAAAAGPGLKSNLPLEVSRIQIPKEIGRVEEFFQGNTNQTILLLQDAHAIPEAQRNLQKLIEHFQNQYGVALTGLEGASEDLDTAVFRSFPDAKRLRQLFEGFFDKGEMTGGTAAAVFGHEHAVYAGVEDWPLYEQGLELYLGSARNQGKNSTALIDWSKDLSAREQNVFSSGLLKVTAALRDFEQNHADLPAILKTLAAVRKPEAGSQLAVMLNEMAREGSDQNDDESQVRVIAEKIKAAGGQTAWTPAQKKEFSGQYQAFQTGQISVQAFALFLKESIQNQKPAMLETLTRIAGDQKKIRDLEGTKFLDEFERYVTQVKESLYQSDAERSLDQEAAMLTLFEKLNKLELSRKEWRQLKSWIVDRQSQTQAGNETGKEIELPENARPVKAKTGVIFSDDKTRVSVLSASQNWADSSSRTGLGLLRSIVTQSESLRTLNLELPAMFKSHFDFYENAEKRDESFLKNLLRRMNSGAPHHSAMLVAGGFHAQGLMQRLKEQGVSYALVMPYLNGVPEKTAYAEQMQGRVSWRGYFKVENGKVSVYKAFVRYVRDQLLGVSSPHASGGDLKIPAFAGMTESRNPKLLKNWRDEVLRNLAKKNQLGKAAEYTHFFDELTEAGKSKTTNTPFAKADYFFEELRALVSGGRLTTQSFYDLLKSVQGGAGLRGLPTATVVAGAVSTIAAANSEMRAPLLGLASLEVPEAVISRQSTTVSSRQSLAASKRRSEMRAGRNAGEIKSKETSTQLLRKIFDTWAKGPLYRDELIYEARRHGFDGLYWENGNEYPLKGNTMLTKGPPASRNYLGVEAIYGHILNNVIAHGGGNGVYLWKESLLGYEFMAFDYGPGVLNQTLKPQDDITKIFDFKSYRGATSISGRGLGANVVASETFLTRVISINDGTVKVVDKPPGKFFQKEYLGSTQRTFETKDVGIDNHATGFSVHGFVPFSPKEFQGKFSEATHENLLGAIEVSYAIPIKRGLWQMQPSKKLDDVKPGDNVAVEYYEISTAIQPRSVTAQITHAPEFTDTSMTLSDGTVFRYYDKVLKIKSRRGEFELNAEQSIWSLAQANDLQVGDLVTVEYEQPMPVESLKNYTGMVSEVPSKKNQGIFILDHGKLSIGYGRIKNIRPVARSEMPPGGSRETSVNSAELRSEMRSSRREKAIIRDLIVAQVAAVLATTVKEYLGKLTEELDSEARLKAASGNIVAPDYVGIAQYLFGEFRRLGIIRPGSLKIRPKALTRYVRQTFHFTPVEMGEFISQSRQAGYLVRSLIWELTRGATFSVAINLFFMFDLREARHENLADLLRKLKKSILKIPQQLQAEANRQQLLESEAAALFPRTSENSILKKAYWSGMGDMFNRLYRTWMKGIWRNLLMRDMEGYNTLPGRDQGFTSDQVWDVVQEEANAFVWHLLHYFLVIVGGAKDLQLKNTATGAADYKGPLEDLIEPAQRNAFFDLKADMLADIRHGVDELVRAFPNTPVALRMAEEPQQLLPPRPEIRSEMRVEQKPPYRPAGDGIDQGYPAYAAGILTGFMQKLAALEGPGTLAEKLSQADAGKTLDAIGEIFKELTFQEEDSWKRPYLLLDRNAAILVFKNGRNGYPYGSDVIGYRIDFQQPIAGQIAKASQSADAVFETLYVPKSDFFERFQREERFYLAHRAAHGHGDAMAFGAKAVVFEVFIEMLFQGESGPFEIAQQLNDAIRKLAPPPLEASAVRTERVLDFMIAQRHRHEKIMRRDEYEKWLARHMKITELFQQLYAALENKGLKEKGLMGRLLHETLASAYRQWESLGAFIDGHVRPYADQGTMEDFLLDAFELGSGWHEVLEVDLAADPREFLLEAIDQPLPAVGGPVRVSFPAEEDLEAFFDGVPAGNWKWLAFSIENAISGANRASDKADGLPQVTLKIEKNELVVTVTDNGTGIPEKNLVRISDADFTTRRGETGQAVMHRVVRDHGGTVNLDSLTKEEVAALSAEQIQQRQAEGKRTTKGVTLTIRWPLQSKEQIFPQAPRSDLGTRPQVRSEMRDEQTDIRSEVQTPQIGLDALIVKYSKFATDQVVTELASKYGAAFTDWALSLDGVGRDLLNRNPTPAIRTAIERVTQDSEDYAKDAAADLNRMVRDPQYFSDWSSSVKALVREKPEEADWMIAELYLKIWVVMAKRFPAAIMDDKHFKSGVVETLALTHLGLEGWERIGGGPFYMGIDELVYAARNKPHTIIFLSAHERGHRVEVVHNKISKADARAHTQISEILAELTAIAFYQAIEAVDVLPFTLQERYKRRDGANVTHAGIRALARSGIIPVSGQPIPGELDLIRLLQDAIDISKGSTGTAISFEQFLELLRGKKLAVAPALQGQQNSQAKTVPLARDPNGVYNNKSQAIEALKTLEPRVRSDRVKVAVKIKTYTNVIEGAFVRVDENPQKYQTHIYVREENKDQDTKIDSVIISSVEISVFEQNQEGSRHPEGVQAAPLTKSEMRMTATVTKTVSPQVSEVKLFEIADAWVKAGEGEVEITADDGNKFVFRYRHFPDRPESEHVDVLLSGQRIAFSHFHLERKATGLDAVQHTADEDDEYTDVVGGGVTADAIYVSSLYRARYKGIGTALTAFSLALAKQKGAARFVEMEVQSPDYFVTLGKYMNPKSGPAAVSHSPSRDVFFIDLAAYNQLPPITLNYNRGLFFRTGDVIGTEQRQITIEGDSKPLEFQVLTLKDGSKVSELKFPSQSITGQAISQTLRLPIDITQVVKYPQPFTSSRGLGYTYAILMPVEETATKVVAATFDLAESGQLVAWENEAVSYLYEDAPLGEVVGAISTSSAPAAKSEMRSNQPGIGSNAFESQEFLDRWLAAMPDTLEIPGGDGAPAYRLQKDLEQPGFFQVWKDGSTQAEKISENGILMQAPEEAFFELNRDQLPQRTPVIEFGRALAKEHQGKGITAEFFRAAAKALAQLDAEKPVIALRLNHLPTLVKLAEAFGMEPSIDPKALARYGNSPLLAHPRPIELPEYWHAAPLALLNLIQERDALKERLISEFESRMRDHSAAAITAVEQSQIGAPYLKYLGYSQDRLIVTESRREGAVRKDITALLRPARSETRRVTLATDLELPTQERVYLKEAAQNLADRIYQHALKPRVVLVMPGSGRWAAKLLQMAWARRYPGERLEFHDIQGTDWKKVKNRLAATKEPTVVFDDTAKTLEAINKIRPVLGLDENNLVFATLYAGHLPANPEQFISNSGYGAKSQEIFKNGYPYLFKPGRFVFGAEINESYLDRGYPVWHLLRTLGKKGAGNPELQSFWPGYESLHAEITAARRTILDREESLSLDQKTQMAAGEYALSLPDAGLAAELERAGLAIVEVDLAKRLPPVFESIASEISPAQQDTIKRRGVAASEMRSASTRRATTVPHPVDGTVQAAAPIGLRPALSSPSVARAEMRTDLKLEEFTLAVGMLMHGGPVNIVDSADFIFKKFDDAFFIAAGIPEPSKTRLLADLKTLNDKIGWDYFNNISGYASEWSYAYSRVGESAEDKALKDRVRTRQINLPDQELLNTVFQQYVDWTRDVKALLKRIMAAGKDFQMMPEASRELWEKFEDFAERNIEINLDAIHAFLTGFGDRAAPNPVEVNTWLQNQVWMTKANSWSSKVRLNEDTYLKFDPASAPLQISADPALLHLALERLISNGFHALTRDVTLPFEKKIVRVQTGRAPDGSVQIVFTNPGSIAGDDLEADLERGMQRLFAYKAKRRSFAGGIGITFAALAIQKLGGTISADNITEDGIAKVRITVTLPSTDQGIVKPSVLAHKQGLRGTFPSSTVRRPRLPKGGVVTTSRSASGHSPDGAVPEQSLSPATAGKPARAEMRTSKNEGEVTAALFEAWGLFEPLRNATGNVAFAQAMARLQNDFGFRPLEKNLDSRQNIAGMTGGKEAGMTAGREAGMTEGVEWLPNPLLKKAVENAHELIADQYFAVPQAQRQGTFAVHLIRELEDASYGKGYEVVLWDRGSGFVDEDGDGIPDVMRLVQFGKGNAVDGGDHVGTSGSIQAADEFEFVTNGFRWIKGRHPFLLHNEFELPYTLTPVGWIGAERNLNPVQSPNGTLTRYRFWENHPGYTASQNSDLDVWLARLAVRVSPRTGQLSADVAAQVTGSDATVHQELKGIAVEATRWSSGTSVNSTESRSEMPPGDPGTTRVSPEARSEMRGMDNRRRLMAIKAAQEAAQLQAEADIEPPVPELDLPAEAPVVPRVEAVKVSSAPAAEALVFKQIDRQKRASSGPLMFRLTLAVGMLSAGYFAVQFRDEIQQAVRPWVEKIQTLFTQKVTEPAVEPVAPPQPLGDEKIAEISRLIQEREAKENPSAPVFQRTKISPQFFPLEIPERVRPETELAPVRLPDLSVLSGPSLVPESILKSIRETPETHSQNIFSQPVSVLTVRLPANGEEVQFQIVANRHEGKPGELGPRPVPDFIFSDSQGRKITLKEITSEKTLIAFVTAEATPELLASMRRLEASGKVQTVLLRPADPGGALKDFETESVAQSLGKTFKTNALPMAAFPRKYLHLTGWNIPAEPEKDKPFAFSRKDPASKRPRLDVVFFTPDGKIHAITSEPFEAIEKEVFEKALGVAEKSTARSEMRSATANERVTVEARQVLGKLGPALAKYLFESEPVTDQELRAWAEQGTLVVRQLGESELEKFVREQMAMFQRTEILRRPESTQVTQDDRQKTQDDTLLTAASTTSPELREGQDDTSPSAVSGTIQVGPQIADFSIQRILNNFAATRPANTPDPSVTLGFDLAGEESALKRVLGQPVVQRLVTQGLISQGMDMSAFRDVEGIHLSTFNAPRFGHRPNMGTDNPFVFILTHAKQTLGIKKYAAALERTNGASAANLDKETFFNGVSDLVEILAGAVASGVKEIASAEDLKNPVNQSKIKAELLRRLFASDLDASELKESAEKELFRFEQDENGISLQVDRSILFRIVTEVYAKQAISSAA